MANLDPSVTIGRNNKGAYTLLHTLLHTKYKSSGPHGFREEDLFYISLLYDPRGVANLNPRGMISRIYVEYHLILLHTKYTSFRPCGFEKKIFKCFPIISLWQIMTPPGRGQFEPLGHDGQD